MPDSKGNRIRLESDNILRLFDLYITLRLQATRRQGLTVRYSMYLVFGKPFSLTFKPCDGLPHRIWQSVLHVLRIPNIYHRIQTKLAVVGIQRLSRCPVEK